MRSQKMKQRVEAALEQVEAAEKHLAFCERRLQEYQFEYVKQVLIEDGSLRWTSNNGSNRLKRNLILVG